MIVDIIINAIIVIAVWSAPKAKPIAIARNKYVNSSGSLIAARNLIIDKAPTGRMYLDGNISVSEDSHSIKERKNLAYNGFLEITIITNQKDTLLN